MSAVFDTPLNGLGVIPLVGSVEGLSMSTSYREALNVLVSACRGNRHGDASHIHRNALFCTNMRGSICPNGGVVLSHPSLCWILGEAHRVETK